ncbi:STAS/SEC14 domain-containing protein [Myxosarcina sp. GI1]|uniref:STAS/SEC14 domain-containing protein n=1 Tax=Myxosarcina sp. GI1 TaxID=1541065 RepID=UPI0005661735|nr:STAS/SEC14 domain-containing protein [Myxosarcina sp. GI1]
MTIKLIPHKPDNIIGINIDGKIEVEDIDRVIELIEKQLQRRGKLRVYAEVENWTGMSLEAFIKDLKFSLQHFKDFEKEAIVSDRQWLKNLAAVGNSLFSGIEVKHFTFADRDKALKWISS